MKVFKRMQKSRSTDTIITVFNVFIEFLIQSIARIARAQTFFMV